MMDATTPEQTTAVKDQRQETKQEPRLLPRQKNKWLRIWDEYGYLLMAAFIPMVLMYIMYLVRGLHPFGDGSVLVLDLNGQYVSFYEALHDILHGESDLLYSFSRALGGEFLGIYDYYIASPFAMLLYFFPERRMLEGLLFVFLVKVAVGGFTMGFYLHKHSRNRNQFAIIAFSIMYTLSSYAIVQQHNSMWIDALLWLPILAYSIEELIKRGHFRLYVFTLAITLYSNFYIGYMVCIFTVAYCFYYYFAHNANNENNPTGEKSHFVKSVGRVALWTALAVGIAAIAILSAKYSLGFGKDDFSNPNWEIEQRFDWLDFLYKFLPSSYDTVRPAGLPFVYCGMLTLVMVPGFFVSRKFSNREKVAAAFMILFFVLSFNISTLDLIWHGFQKPNWLNYRYSFMLCFFLVVLAYRAFDQIEFTSRKTLLLSTGFIGLLILVFQKLMQNNLMFSKMTESNDDFKFHPFATIWLALGCLFVYFILVSLMGRKREINFRRKRETVSILLLVAVCIEIFVNGLFHMNSLDDDVVYSKYSRYNNLVDTFRPISSKVQEYDKGFYRMEKSYMRKTNDNFALQMKGLSCSTSTLNADTIVFLREMGYASKSNWSKYMGGTPVNDSLLGLKYLISDDKELSKYYGEPIFSPEDYGYDEDFTPLGDYYVYLNPYAQSFAYGVSDAWMNFDTKIYDSPFERLNAMVTAMLGESETVQVFKPAIPVGKVKLNNVSDKSKTTDGELVYAAINESQAASMEYTYTVPQDTELFFYYPTKYKREVKLTANGISKGTFAANETDRIISLGSSKTDQLKLNVKISTDAHKVYVCEKTSYVYYVDMGVFTDAMKRLQKTSYIIDDSSVDSHITGSISTPKDRQLIFTSIPYDEGWNIYVDGEKVEIFETADALISFYVDDAGEHTLEMRYMPHVIAFGFACSATFAAVFIVLLILYPFRKRIPGLRKIMEIDAPDLPIIEPEEDVYLPGEIGAITKEEPPVDPNTPIESLDLEEEPSEKSKQNKSNKK